MGLEPTRLGGALRSRENLSKVILFGPNIFFAFLILIDTFGTSLLGKEFGLSQYF